MFREGQLAGGRHYDVAALNRVLRASPGDLDVPIPATAVRGEIPAELWGGTLFGNGPGRIELGGRLIHPFDGHGYVRALRFSRQGLRLQARFVQTPCYAAESAADAVCYRGLGTLLPGGARRNVWAPDFRNVANTCVLVWGGKLYALWEGGPPYELDPETLATRGLATFGGLLAERTPLLAHTRYDAQRERLVGLSPTLTSRRVELHFHELDRQGALIASTHSALDGMSLYHDFVITDDFYLVLENRVQPDLGAFLRYKLGMGTVMEILRTNPQWPGRILVVPRRPGAQAGRVFTLDGPLFAFHHANAWQEGRRIVLVSCVNDALSFGREFGYRGAALPFDPGVVAPIMPLQRLELDLDSGRVARRPLGEYAIDFPRIQPRFDGRPIRYVYGATNAIRGLPDPFDTLVRVEVTSGACDTYTPQPQQLVGEPIVVAQRRSGAGAADSGEGPVWLLVMLYDGHREQTTLAIFGDAPSAGPVATIELPLLPYGFHGHWEGAPES